MIGRIAAALLAATALAGAGRAQTVSPAQLGVDQSTPQGVYILDKNRVWNPFGSMQGGVFTQNFAHLDPRSFGAKCDNGLTDDTGALNTTLGKIKDGTVLDIPGGCGFSSPLAFPIGFKDVTVNGGTLIYIGASTTLNPAVSIGAPNTLVCKGQGWIINGLRVRSTTTMSAGVGLRIGDMCRTQFNGLTVGDQNSSGFIGPAGREWWDAIEAVGGNTVRYNAVVARSQHHAVRVHGDNNGCCATDITFNGLSALASGVGLHLSGGNGGFQVDNAGDMLNNTISNVRISQDDVAYPNAQLFFGFAPIDGTGADVPGLDLVDPGASSSFLSLNGTWFSYARTQCFVVEATAQTWVIQLNGGQIITCGSGAGLGSYGGFTNLSTSTDVHISMNGTVFNKNQNHQNVYNVTGANPIAMTGISLVDATIGSIVGKASGSAVDNSGTIRVFGYGAAQLKTYDSSVLITAGSTKAICMAAVGGVGLWVTPGLLIPGDPSCSTGGGVFDLGVTATPFRSLGLGAQTVAALNSSMPCSAANAGRTARVSDAASPTWHATLVGGGSGATADSQAYCNGANWVAQ